MKSNRAVTTAWVLVAMSLCLQTSWADWTEDFSSGYGQMTNVIDGAAGSYFVTNSGGSAWLDCKTVRSAISERRTRSLGESLVPSSQMFAFRAKFKPTTTQANSHGRIGFFTAVEPNDADALTCRWGHDGTAVQFWADVMGTAGNEIIGSAVTAGDGTTYFIRGTWFPTGGNHGTFQVKIATGNYDDLGGTLVGTTSADLEGLRTFEVDQLGIGNLPGADTGAWNLSQLHEMTYDDPDTPDPAGWTEHFGYG